MGGRILVVEDTPHNLELMTYLLEAHGHTVTAALTGEQGIELATQTRPDLIVMDLQLPGIDGYQALAAVRSAAGLTAVPVVAVTSFAMVGDRDRALEAGFDDYLTKPIDPETFTADVDLRLPERLRGALRVRPTPAPGGTTEPAKSDRPELIEQDAADILVVDDSATNQTLLRSVLEPYGYQVRTAHTVEEAVAELEQRGPDLVLCDVQVSHRRGGDLLSYLRAVPALAQVPFAFLTATAESQDLIEFDGTVNVIRQPIEPAALIDVVKALLTAESGG
jgi:two-component system, cell cycle response regulator